MARKNFEAINTGRVYESIEKATGKKQQTKEARINLACTQENYDFIRIMSKATGRTMTEFINDVIAEYRTANPELQEKAAGFLDFVNKGSFSAKGKK